MKHLLVCGAGGFIGGHLVKRLKAEGHSVRGVDVKQGLPYQPWAREKVKNRRMKDDPYVNCIVPGGPRMHLLPTMKKIVQTPALLIKTSIPPKCSTVASTQRRPLSGSRAS